MSGFDDEGKTSGRGKSDSLMFRRHLPEPVRFRQKLRYRFDTFMARGGSSIFKALLFSFLAIFFLIAGARGLFQLLAPEMVLQWKHLDFLGNAYITFLQMTDPGNMAQDISSSPWYKVFSIAAGLVGVVMLSALIAFITTALDQKLHELRRGRSKVIEEGHTLILGWNEQRIIEVLRELIIANESEKDACVVIMADRDKEEMDEVLRLRLPERKTTRVVTRSGNIASLASLDTVSIEYCKSIVILADCGEVSSEQEKSSSDAHVIQTILATSGIGPDHDDFCIVAEIFNPAHREIVETTFLDHVVTVNTSDILAKLLVQTSRSVGLSIVYNEILSFDGCEMYFHHAVWAGETFANLGYHFPDGVPMGVRNNQGEVRLNPPLDYVMQDDDDILILADDDSTIEYRKSMIVKPQEFEVKGERLSQHVERELILGWNKKAPVIIHEFSEYVMENSQIHIVLKEPTKEEISEIEKLDKTHDTIEIKLIQKNCLDRDELMEIEPFNYDNIIILAGNAAEHAGMDAQQIDSENIVALLLLRNIFDQYKEKSQNTKLITEVLDSQNYSLVARAGVKDVIISNRLVSMMMAQISESHDIKMVYDDLFEEEGSEIYLKPVSLYFDQFPVEANFADMMKIVQKRGEICLGVKIKALEDESEENNGVNLIPKKTQLFKLNIEDSLVVLSEDEL